MGDFLLSLARMHRHKVEKSRITLLSCIDVAASEKRKAADAKTLFERESQTVTDFPPDLKSVMGFDAWLKRARATIVNAELGLQSAIDDTDSARAEMYMIKVTEKAILHLKGRRASNLDAIALKQNRNELEELLGHRLLHLKLTLQP